MTDEFFHEPTGDPYWSESFYLDFAGEQLQGYVRFGFYPNRRSANVWAYLLGDTMNWVRDESFPPEQTHGLCFRGDDWSLSLLPDPDSRHWRLKFSGTMNQTALPGREEEPASPAREVKVDLLARGVNEPFFYSEGRDFPDLENFEHWEQAIRVTGEVQRGSTTRTVRAPGTRDHSWGSRKWGDDEWLGDGWVWTTGGFPDGRAFTCMLAGYTGTPSLNGFWFDGSTNRPLASGEATVTPPLNPGTARAWADGQFPEISLNLGWGTGGENLRLTPVTATPMELQGDKEGLVSNRSPCRVERSDGTVGHGFISASVPA